MVRSQEIIKRYSLIPLENEGGYFSFLSSFGNDAGCIFYLITKNSFSSLHALKNDEVWFFLEGGNAEQVIYENGERSVRVLGKDSRFSLVRKNCFQATRLLDGDYALFSTVMSPRYNASDYITPSSLFLSSHPEAEDLL